MRREELVVCVDDSGVFVFGPLVLAVVGVEVVVPSFPALFSDAAG